MVKNRIIRVEGLNWDLEEFIGNKKNK